MEDAHATILNLDNPDESAQAQCGAGKKGKRSFFAVYDGHGGQSKLMLRAVAVTQLRFEMLAGSTVARFSGDTVHKRLRDLDLYNQQKYQEAMTRAFIKTDEDLRSSA